MKLSRSCSWTLVLSALVLASSACSGSDDGATGGSSGGSGNRGPIGKADNTGQCATTTQSFCGGKSDGTCWCDDQCSSFGDCCNDYGSTCGGTEECVATFHWLQKDAYKDTAGRTSDMWPPHTTTTLEISCNGSVVRSEFRENHGTKPGALDANGQVFLVDVAQKQVTGPRTELEALADQYASCECGNEFLSLNGLNDPKVQPLIGKLSDYMLQNLTCSGATDTQGLINLITSGDIPGALAVLPNCSWSSGADFEAGLDAALQAVIAASNETLGAYHVCNNDAMLQAGLFEGYATSKSVGACDPNATVCAGPAWFYKP
jgi:hypothetical protein